MQSTTTQDTTNTSRIQQSSTAAAATTIATSSRSQEAPKAGSIASCVAMLAECEMFQKVSPTLLQKIAHHMDYITVKNHEKFIHQDDPVNAFYLLESGNIKRKFVDPKDQRSHNVEFAIKAKSINSMRVLTGEPAHSTVQCTSSNDCRMFQMKRDVFLKLVQQNPNLSLSIMQGLCQEVRGASKKYRTPLLEQQKKDDVNLPAVAIAAGMESYYRSALNAMLNARLTGVAAEWFPNMHIQVPTRIAYIAGFKTLRSYLDKTIEPESYDYPNAVRIGVTVSPGVLMTPISSILEASNAGHMNKEPIWTRWMRGVVPRCGREIIFGVGLNQLSDYFEERFLPVLTPKTDDMGSLLKSSDSSSMDDSSFSQKTIKMQANAAGSLAAGVVAGYLSHVPHNLSTLKLLEPQKSYGQLYSKFVSQSVPPIVQESVASWQSPTARTVARTVFATLFPRGLLVRTTQIVGSFIILNGTINFLQLQEHKKIQKALATSTWG